LIGILRKDQYGNENDIDLKYQSTEVIELLIYHWLSRITSFYDITYCLSKTENPIESMKTLDSLHLFEDNLELKRLLMM